VRLYTTGLRRGELLRLTRGDYDPQAHTLLIRESKFHTSRLVPLSADAAVELEASLAARRPRGRPVAGDAPLLGHGPRSRRAYTGGGFAQGLRALLRTARIRTAAGRLPRVHDLRHTFAVHALVRWYRAGVDVQAKLPLLAAYLGHVSIVSTQVYLPFVEPLAAAASARFARACGALVAAPNAPGGAP
jgi:integrase